MRHTHTAGSSPVDRTGFREAHTYNEATLLCNSLARNQRKTTESHINPQTKFPSSLQNTLPLPHVESECQLSIFRSEDITLQYYWYQVKLFHTS